MANIPELQSRSLLLQTPERRRDFLLVIRKSWTFATTLVLCIVSGRHTRAKVYFWPLNGKQSQWSTLAWHVPHVLESSLLVSVPRFWILAAKSCLFCCHRSVHLVGPPGGPNNSACKAKKKKGAPLQPSKYRREPTVDVVNYAALLSLISRTILESQESRPGGGRRQWHCVELAGQMPQKWRSGSKSYNTAAAATAIGLTSLTIGIDSEFSSRSTLTPPFALHSSLMLSNDGLERWGAEDYHIPRPPSTMRTLLGYFYGEGEGIKSRDSESANFVLQKCLKLLCMLCIKVLQLTKSKFRMLARPTDSNWKSTSSTVESTANWP